MQLDLAALVGSRICHDLISPIGAIGNGVELLTLTDGDTSAEMSLVAQSVENANARIRYFRIAYGAAAPDQRIGRNDVLSILTAMADGGRLRYDWRLEGDRPRQLVRAAFLLLQCFEAALPLGGQITIAQDGKDWVVSVQNSRLKMDQPLWDSLSNSNASYPHSAAQVQFALLPQVLAEAGRNLSLSMTEDQISARF